MDPSASRSRQPLALLATAAMVGQIVLLASALILPFYSEFSLIGDNISELALGRYGFVQTVALIVAGLGTLALAYAIRQLTAGVWGSTVGSLLIAAIFPTDRIDTPEDLQTLSTTGLIHSGVFLVSIICVIIGMFVLLRTFQLDSGWRSLFPWLGLFPAAALLLLFVQGEGPWVGLYQRLLIGAVAAWQIVVAVRIRTIAASAEPTTSG